MLQEFIAIHPRTLAVAQAVERFCDEHGFSPTVRELGDMVGLHSSATIQWHVQAAVEAGLLQQENAARCRTLRPVRERCSHGRP